MKKIIIIVIATILLHETLPAQGLLKRLKDKAAQATESAIGTKMTNTANKVINGEQAPAKEEATSPASTITEKPSVMKQNSRFDFVPANNIVFAEDFSQDVIGEFPLQWFTQSTGEIVTLEGKEGKWLRMVPEGIYLSSPISLKENYTIEFDLVLTTPVTGWTPGNLIFGLYDNGGGKKPFKAYEFKTNNYIELNIAGWVKNSRSTFDTWENGAKKTVNAKGEIADFLEQQHSIVHISMSIQKERFRLWVGQNKIYDLPDAMPAGAVFNQLKLAMGSTNYKKDENAYYITNIKLAAGSPDTRSKLVTEGKLVTTAIVFGVNSAEISPLSAPILKEIGTALKENETMKIRITGHTDSDGDNAANLALSQRRAEAVKAYLAANFQVQQERMETDGKGETMPVAPNTNAVGKANNRRVEFLKL